MIPHLCIVFCLFCFADLGRGVAGRDGGSYRHSVCTQDGLGEQLQLQRLRLRRLHKLEPLGRRRIMLLQQVRVRRLDEFGRGLDKWRHCHHQLHKSCKVVYTCTTQLLARDDAIQHQNSYDMICGLQRPRDTCAHVVHTLCKHMQMPTTIYNVIIILYNLNMSHYIYYASL